MKYLLYISLAFLTFSCTDLKKEEQLTSINELSEELAKLSASLEDNKMDSIPSMTLATSGVELRIKRHYKSDTIDMAFGHKMDRYKIMRRQVPKLGSEQTRIQNSITETKEKIDLLKTDIENAAGERDKYDEYISNEANKVEQISVLLEGYLQMREEVLATYNELHPELYSYSMELVEKDK